MRKILGNIYDPHEGLFKRGILYYSENIVEIIPDDTVREEVYILPGLIDAHVHIESSMMNPIEYAKESLRHGVVAAVTDPHEIANVCGVRGIMYMVNCVVQVPMKIITGAPSCVPATNMESSGAIIGADDIEQLFKNNQCSHLAEMMNFPGVLFNDSEVISKLDIAKKYNKVIDGHAPMLSGQQLVQYAAAGITTDHECTTLSEAIEKIGFGMKIMLRQSSASKDFEKLDKLIDQFPDSIMFCTDDCHPDELQKGYIEKLFRKALYKKYSIQNIIKGATINAINHYGLNVGYLRKGDPSDFIVVDNLKDFTILKTVINGKEVFNGNDVLVDAPSIASINNFFCNTVSLSDIQVKAHIGKSLNVIEIVPDSLLTKHITIPVSFNNGFIESYIGTDVLKIVVVNRYAEAKPTVGFIKGFGIKKGAIGGSVAHDSHNIIVVGADDKSILKAINLIQQSRGGLIAINDEATFLLPLPIAGLMSEKCCAEVADEYKTINDFSKSMGTSLNAPFMTLAFMALLVIPELKIGDKGLFNINTYSFVDLQS
jgi:adenine deaminase